MKAFVFTPLAARDLNGIGIILTHSTFASVIDQYYAENEIEGSCDPARNARIFTTTPHEMCCPSRRSEVLDEKRR